MTVTTALDGGLAWVHFGTGERANALTTAIRQDLLATLTRLAAESTVRAVVLQGRGDHFCAGQDLSQHHERLEADPDSIDGMVRREFNPIIKTIASMPKPVVAALTGAVTGAGLGLALACDLRLSSTTAKFSTSFARVGLGPDSGVSWFLPRLVGSATAADLLLRPRIVDAAEALALGLVHEVHPPEDLTERARAVGAEFAAGPTVAYAAIKATLAASVGSLESSLDAEGTWQGIASTTGDHTGAVAAFINKQTPRFSGE